MEKVLNAMPQNDGNKVKAEKALEINPNHPIFEKLKDLYANDKDKLKDYAKLLYDQHCLSRVCLSTTLLSLQTLFASL